MQPATGADPAEDAKSQPRLTNGSTRRNVLFIPAWYPSAENPVAADFIRQHARAASSPREFRERARDRRRGCIFATGHRLSLGAGSTTAGLARPRRYDVHFQVWSAVIGRKRPRER